LQEPKKMIRYLDSKVVSVKGEKLTEIKKTEDESIKNTYINLKPARQYRFHWFHICEYLISLGWKKTLWFWQCVVHSQWTVAIICCCVYHNQHLRNCRLHSRQTVIFFVYLSVCTLYYFHFTACFITSAKLVMYLFRFYVPLSLSLCVSRFTQKKTCG